MNDVQDAQDVHDSLNPCPYPLDALPEALKAELDTLPPYSDPSWRKESERLFRLVSEHIVATTGRAPTELELSDALPTGSAISLYRVFKSLRHAVKRETKRKAAFLRQFIFGR